MRPAGSWPPAPAPRPPCSRDRLRGQLVAARRRGSGSTAALRGAAGVGAGGALAGAVLEQPFGMARELDRAEPEEDEDPLPGQREDPGDPLGAAQDPAEHRAA